MIQRIQSIYLLIVAALMSLLMAVPYAEIDLGNNEVIRFYAFALQKLVDGDQAEKVSTTAPLAILVLIAATVSFLNIFLFRRRVLQMRICLLTSVVMIIQLGLIYLYFQGAKGDFGTSMPSFNLPAVFPLISTILLIMAYRAILHDESLVKSYDRIR